ncbi:NACHT domain-containing protein [Pseudonocardia sp. Cha107L01]|uniref:NACHT domain-containing protein n=1 Tax=Pseudonocardia sp. Cha107L01 TaxID=3457576 RepID=UPI00403EA0AA
MKNTSGGGFTYEDQVGAYLAAALLADSHVLDVELGPPFRIDFQTAVDGWRLDDVLIHFSTPSGTSRWCVSVKSGAYFAGAAPSDLNQRLWAELAQQSGSPFDEQQDLFGLITPPLEQGSYADLHELIRISRNQDLSEVNSRVMTTGYSGGARQAMWTSFAAPATLGLDPTTSGSPARVLKRLRCMGLDFAFSPSRSEADATRLCADSLRDRSQAVALWTALLAEVARVRTAGGYLDADKLIAKLGGGFDLRQDTSRRRKEISLLNRRCVARLVERWLAAGASAAVASRFAHDASVGARDLSLPNSGVVALCGEFGTGKSVAAERIHQRDIAAHLSDPTRPVPIFVTARDIAGGLETEVRNLTSRWADVDRCGVALIIDDLDELGVPEADKLLHQARVLCRTLPNSRVVVTTRPLLFLRSEEQVAVPVLTAAAVQDLADLFSGSRNLLWKLSPPAAEAVRRPLFAIVALARLSQSADVPSSPAHMLQALVEHALRSAPQGSFDLLAHAAVRSLGTRKRMTVNEVGGPDVASSLTHTRLVVQEGRSLRFALPVIEQYFAAQALLREESSANVSLESMDDFEAWRWAYVIAAGFGDADDVDRLIERLGDRWPGAAIWVTTQAVSSGLAIEEAPESDIPGAHEFALRIRRALTALTAWLPDASAQTKLVDSDHRVVTVGTRVAGGWLTAGNVLGCDQDTVEFDADIDPLAPDNSWDTPILTRSRIRAYEPSWTWSLARGWLASSLEGSLKARRLGSSPTSPLAEERSWHLTRCLVGDRGRAHRPVDAAAIVREGQVLIESLGAADLTSTVGFDRGTVRFTLGEIVTLVSQAESQNGPFVRPCRAPDVVSFGDGSVSRTYSDGALLELATEIYSAALRGYEEIIGRWFPQLSPTLGWASVAPIRLDITLIPAADGREPRFIVHESAAESVQDAGVYPRRGSRPDIDRFWSGTDLQRPESTAALRPGSGGWHSLSGHFGAVDLFSDTPATDLAYEWVWRDLHGIGLVGRLPVN